jgi:hypothetical protein
MVDKETIDFIKELAQNDDLAKLVIENRERADLVENVRRTQQPYQPQPTIHDKYAISDK